MSSLRITSFIAWENYRGCYGGAPSREFVIEIAREQALRHWGVQPTLLKTPPPGKFLPRWTMLAWLDGPPRSEYDDGTHLVVIWFSDEGPTTKGESYCARSGKHGGRHVSLVPAAPEVPIKQFYIVAIWEE